MTSAALLALTACEGGGADAGPSAAADAAPSQPMAKQQTSEPEADGADEEAVDAIFTTEAVAQFSEPWAMTFLPDGRMLVTEKPGALYVVTQSGDKGEITGVPTVDYGGQGGFGDVALHPQFADNGTIYVSYVEAGEDDTRGAVVARGQLALTDAGGTLSDLEVIWRQNPKVTGRGHYSHRILFTPDGQHIFISSGERQKFDPAQDMQQNLGKIIRLNHDGSVPDDNPFADQGGVTAEIWSLGHRNILGIAFDAEGQLWEHEMGPKGGDEFNRIVKGENYGYPTVSNGDHYDGRPMPDHDTRPEFMTPEESWTPVISPAGLIIYKGNQFPEWTGSALIGGLSSQSLIRVAFDCPLDNRDICEAERFNMNQRIREVEEGPDGAIWLLEDGSSNGESGGRLLKLTPA
ncbi:PQQ-dependent sugar dehydrogenase [Parvularcula sp. LCG005]|uniref:PQQ-dependent sugar dehydrogenase n=1 Tax=Parvularcula sp. LCG005 TaxID=3078805 RepID=UPI00397E1577